PSLPRPGTERFDPKQPLADARSFDASPASNCVQDVEINRLGDEFAGAQPPVMWLAINGRSSRPRHSSKPPLENELLVSFLSRNRTEERIPAHVWLWLSRWSLATVKTSVLRDWASRHGRGGVLLAPRAGFRHVVECLPAAHQVPPALVSGRQGGSPTLGQ